MLLLGGDKLLWIGETVPDQTIPHAHQLTFQPLFHLDLYVTLLRNQRILLASLELTEKLLRQRGLDLSIFQSQPAWQDLKQRLRSVRKQFQRFSEEGIATFAINENTINFLRT